MKLQIIQDSKGKATGVFIPIKDWNELKKQYKDLERLEYEVPTKEEILQGLKEAVEQVNLAKKGKIKLKPVRQLLDVI